MKFIWNIPIARESVRQAHTLFRNAEGTGLDGRAFCVSVKRNRMDAAMEQADATCTKKYKFRFALLHYIVGKIIIVVME